MSLPESERLSLNEKAFQTSDFHPTGKIEILLSFDLYDPLKVRKGLTAHPNIGAKVFVSSGALVQEYLSKFGVKNTNQYNNGVACLGHLVSNPSTSISVSLQSVFGRHCAIVGTTGGGKSYTVSKLIESITELNGKAILIDATGEYNGKYQEMKSINIGDGKHVFHYTQLTVDDMFFLLKPSEKVQVPKLMEAIRSLKIVRLNNGQSLQTNNPIVPNTVLTITVENGVLKKEDAPKRPYQAFYHRNMNLIEDGLASFDIKNLPQQISEECVFSNADKWTGSNSTDVGNCVSLISRASNLIRTPEYNQIFGFEGEKDEFDITNVVNQFLADKETRILRLNFENVKFDFQVREILANAIGKYLLNKARNRDFINNPVVTIIDEAHQFLNKSIKDEYFASKSLDSFDSIAKECRKHGLFLCIATQMPRDIPHSTLSQMGTFIVHRLINYNDKEAIMNACSSANKNTLDFLPILGEGEAILTGVDFPMPIIMKFDEPFCKPDSKTPNIFPSIAASAKN